jgi:hypothetical protein
VLRACLVCIVRGWSLEVPQGGLEEGEGGGSSEDFKEGEVGYVLV